jgi:hypothetical protein
MTDLKASYEALKAELLASREEVYSSYMKRENLRNSHKVFQEMFGGFATLTKWLETRFSTPCPTCIFLREFKCTLVMFSIWL